MTLNLRRKLLLIGAPVVLVGAGLTTMAARAAAPTLTTSSTGSSSAFPSPATGRNGRPVSPV